MHGVFTDKPGVLTNDFFVNLLDMSTEWNVSKSTRTSTKASTARPARTSGPRRHRPGVRFELALRALAEVYAADDAKEKFVKDFVSAWVKVMDNDRFDLHR